MKPEKSSISGIDANKIVLVAYLGGLVLSWISGLNYFAWLLPLVIYLIEKDSEFVKQQSAQAFIIYVISAIVSIFFSLVGMILFKGAYIFDLDLFNFSGSLILLSLFKLVTIAFSLFITVIVIITTVKVWNYEKFELPLISMLTKSVRELLDKLTNSKVPAVEPTKEETTLKEELPEIKEAPEEETESTPKAPTKKTSTTKKTTSTTKSKTEATEEKEDK